MHHAMPFVAISFSNTLSAARLAQLEQLASLVVLATVFVSLAEKMTGHSALHLGSE
jgi:hypothetical protein